MHKNVVWGILPLRIQSKSAQMKWIFGLLLFIASPLYAAGAVHAVVTSAPAPIVATVLMVCAASSGAPGAFVGVPSTLTRGDIYYLCDGTTATI